MTFYKCLTQASGEILGEMILGIATYMLLWPLYIPIKLYVLTQALQ